MDPSENTGQHQMKSKRWNLRKMRLPKHLPRNSSKGSLIKARAITCFSLLLLGTASSEETELNNSENGPPPSLHGRQFMANAGEFCLPYYGIHCAHGMTCVAFFKVLHTLDCSSDEISIITALETSCYHACTNDSNCGRHETCRSIPKADQSIGICLPNHCPLP